MNPCYREPTNGVYFTRNAHRHDCVDAACRGCVTCSERHCSARRNCAWHIAEGELTCGRCLAATRRDLRWISDLSGLMLFAAIADGVNSESANLAGPAADPEAWSWRKASANAGRAWHVSLVEEDDEHHPLRVLGTWEQMLREDYGHEAPTSVVVMPDGSRRKTVLPTTVTSARDYLDRQLHRIAHDDGQDFALLARELRKCRQHLEAVLHNDDRPDRGAPCPDCTSEQTGVGPRLVRQYAHWCEDEGCERIHIGDEADDAWQCPKVREHRWTHKAYSNWLQDRKARVS